MIIGKLGAVPATCIVILGITLSIESMRIDPSRMAPWFMTAKKFMAVPFISTLIFGGFVATGILNRRRPEIHRPMMLLATLTVISAAASWHVNARARCKREQNRPEPPLRRSE